MSYTETTNSSSKSDHQLVICLTSDLMMTGKISSIARKESINCRIFASFNPFQSFVAETANGLNTIWLIDLQRCGDNVEQIKQLGQILEPSPRIIGYAQHVHPELIQEAKQNGFDEVLTRGRFDQSVEQILTSL